MAYLCESVIDVVGRSGIPMDFYPLGEDLRMNVEEFITQRGAWVGTEAVVIINYFGIVDLRETIAELQQYGQLVVIEDDVQSLFSFVGNDNGSVEKS